MAEKISSELTDLPVSVIYNPDFNLGQSSSMIAGIKAADIESSLMFVLGDQPLIKPETINFLLRKHDIHKKIIVPSYYRKLGHPVIFPKMFRPALLSLTGDLGAKKIITCNQSQTLVIDIQDKGIIQDIDTWDDYQFLKKEV
jgi:molybdenum cofactor cytidylyltransferase